MQLPHQLLDSCQDLAKTLVQHKCKVVFAESCTAGWLSALLSTVPGISQSLCGSSVVYRELTKQHWLDVSAEALDDPAIGTVSSDVATQMVLGVLTHTPEADFAAAITGHLGPNAPAELDGVAYVAIGRRMPDSISLLLIDRIQLTSQASKDASLRWHRQQEAIEFVYRRLTKTIQNQFAPANRSN